MFFYRAYGSECGDLLGGGSVQDVRMDLSAVDHEIIHARKVRELQPTHPCCEVHVEEIAEEEYGLLAWAAVDFNTID